jgi:DNA (cytosine-5)-methyltransferase 1
MKHLGDITKISGYTAPIVDCIIGGSPCQDLSVAGKRAGLEGERSGLFMEQIRIVKEMRDEDERSGRTGVNVRPRYMVWENVPGAFSSNGGADFQAVLSEIVRIAESEAPDVPMPDKGKWNKSGCIYDELGRWSVAWRVHDAQFWGVPQRRKRIALVADFGGLTAPEILFERESLRGHFAEGGSPRESLAAYAEGSSGIHDSSGSSGNGNQRAVEILNPWDSQGNQVADATGGHIFPTLRGCGGAGYQAGYLLAVAYAIVAVRYIVRRLTPLECERLQGFPDGWTDIGEWVDSKGKKHKEADSPRYKALGNSIALPFWQWMARKICAQYERDITMASLFDGIGGFPLVFERCGAKAVWASEIEEFPMAVTKLRFPEE